MLTARLSEQSKALILKLKSNSETNGLLPDFMINEPGAVFIQKLVPWIIKKKKNKEAYFLLESLYSSLLQDIYYSLPTVPKRKASETNWSAILKLIVVAISGFLFFGSSGFDAAASFLGIFSVPALPVFIVGTLFSLISIGVFLSLNLVGFAKSLDINLISATKIINIYHQEVEAIQAIEAEINSYYARCKKEELEENLLLIALLIARYKELGKARENLTELKENELINTGKKICSAISGAFMFIGGFLAGQTLVVTTLSLFSAASAIPPLWPVLIVGTIIGLAALAVFWLYERPNLENLMSSMIGLDAEKIDNLIDPKKVEKQLSSLNTLKRNIEVTLNKMNKSEEQQQQITKLNQKISELQAPVSQKTMTPQETIQGIAQPQAAPDNQILMREEAVKKLPIHGEVIVRAENTGLSFYSKVNAIHRSKSLNDLSKLNSFTGIK